MSKMETGEVLFQTLNCFWICILKAALLEVTRESEKILFFFNKNYATSPETNKNTQYSNINQGIAVSLKDTLVQFQLDFFWFAQFLASRKRQHDATKSQAPLLKSSWETSVTHLRE